MTTNDAHLTAVRAKTRRLKEILGSMGASASVSNDDDHLTIWDAAELAEALDDVMAIVMYHQHWYQAENSVHEDRTTPAILLAGLDLS